MILFMRVYDRMNQYDFYDFLQLFWGESSAQEAFEKRMKEEAEEDENAE